MPQEGVSSLHFLLGLIVEHKHEILTLIVIKSSVCVITLTVSRGRQMFCSVG